MENKKKIGIMGGTFNPIHNGHLMLGQWARDRFDLDQIIFIPTGCSYLKKNDNVLPGEIRFEMVNLAIKDNPCFTSSNIEVLRQGDTYTYETLQELKKIYVDADLYFIVGADCLFFIEKWYKVEEIFKNCILIAANRNGIDDTAMQAKKKELEDRFQCRIELISFPTIDLSSTDIRNKVKAGESIKYMVPDACLEFIEKEALYK